MIPLRSEERVAIVPAHFGNISICAVGFGQFFCCSPPHMCVAPNSDNLGGLYGLALSIECGLKILSNFQTDLNIEEKTKRFSASQSETF